MDKKGNNLLLIAGAGIVGWILAPKEVKEQITGGMPGIGIDLSGLLGGGLDFGGLLPEFEWPEFKVPEFEWPEFKVPDFEFPEWEWPPLPEGWIPDVPEWMQDPPSDTPSEVPGNNGGEVTDGGGLMPTGISPTKIQDFARRTSGLLGRQYGGAVLTGTHLIRPLPLAGLAEKAGIPLRTVTKVIPKVTPQALTRMAKQPLTGKMVMQLTERGLGKAAPKILPRVGVAGLKVGARAVPVIGWGLLGVDVLADLARVFGADMPEWLGLSGLVSAFTGENPLEKYMSTANTALAAGLGGGGIVGGVDIPISEGYYAPAEVPAYSEGAYTRPSITPTVIAPKPFEPKKTYPKKTYHTVPSELPYKPIIYTTVPSLR